MNLFTKLKNFPTNDGKSLEQKFEDIAKGMIHFYDGWADDYLW